MSSSMMVNAKSQYVYGECAGTFTPEELVNNAVHIGAQVKENEGQIHQRSRSG